MKLILTISESGVYLDKEPLPDNAIPQIALHSRVIDKSDPTKLIVDFRASLETPGIWRLPLEIIKRLY